MWFERHRFPPHLVGILDFLLRFLLSYQMPSSLYTRLEGVRQQYLDSRDLQPDKTMPSTKKASVFF